ncbi:MAG: hypothetical protein AAGB31_02545 [Bdellovibrio sp.]
MSRSKNYLAGIVAICSLMILILSGAWYHQGSQAEKTRGLASKSNFETAEQCGPERNYLLKDLKKISPVFLRTRLQAKADMPSRECISYIMQNFIPLNAKSPAMSQCKDAEGNALSAPTRGEKEKGFFPPCVTEEYVNSVYNSLMDVGDCLNVPIKELLPKLYNESGLHLNALGGGMDGGVGQLTVTALSEVFSRYNGESRFPSSLDWYVREMKKSAKESCRRIVAEKNIYQLPVPEGKKLCIYGEAQDENCYAPWSLANRCVVMAAPESPLRNVLFTAVFYRNMLKNATGIGYAAGEDILSGRLYREGEQLNGYIGNGKLNERLQQLGVTQARPEILRQMMVSLGFNAGIGSVRIFMENYIKQKEAKNQRLTNEHFDFQTRTTGKWAIVTNLATFWRGLGSPDEAEFQKALNLMEVVRELGVDPTDTQNKYRQLRPLVQKDIEEVDALQLNEEDREKKISVLKVRYDKYRHPLLAEVFVRSDDLSLPEYIRIAHAQAIATSTRAGGAPGYLSFIASRHLILEKEMGAQVCTAQDYLKF